MKKIWTSISLISMSLASTLQVGAGSMDMGGFQIQIEQKEDMGIETEPRTENDIDERRDDENDDEKHEQVSPVPRETHPVMEEQTEKEGEGEQQTEIPGAGSEERGISYGEEGTPAVQGEEEGWTVLQQDTGEAEEDIVSSISEGIREEAGPPTEDGQVVTGPAQREQKKEKRVQQERHGREGRSRSSEKKAEKIRFIHEDRTRLLGKIPLAVRLEGGQEVCVLSCAVNHRECVYRWEKDCLVPLDPSLQKGVNCMEISVLLPDGQIVSMEPWYFSCGVGLAVL